MVGDYKMPCYFPNRAYWSVDDNEHGNRYITFKHREGFVDLPVMLPCGKCIGCRLEHARQWAVRCVHEASMHESNCFITLTYNDDNLPEHGSLKKKDLQDFFKRLRRSNPGETIRYYAAGEYGDNLGRPHYHACIFGYDFKDKEVFVAGQRKYPRNQYSNAFESTLYTSKHLEERWQNGFCTIGDLTFESAGYVARYCTKKVSGDKAVKHYGKKQPEFAIMSRKPGIGKGWIEKYKGDIYPKDFFTHKGQKMRPVRFYDKHVEEEKPKLLKEVKQKRFEYNAENYESSQRKIERWHFKRKQAKQLLKRRLDHGTNGI